MHKDQVSINTLQVDGKPYSDSFSKADILNNYFSSVFTKDNELSPPNISSEPVPPITQITVEVDGVYNLLTNLDPHKAAGPDGIPSKLLKETASQIAPLLTFIFQASLNQGKLPSDWKSANITPIHKKGKRTDPSNYRPISLTSICSKTLEHVIYSSIFSHLETHKILDDCQHGFRTHRSCETQLIGAITDFQQCLNNRKHIDAIFLDFSKAFDKVSHSKLCHKLFHYGINGQLLLWIKDYLSDRSQSVVLDGTSSGPHPVISGVPQGTVLAPLLFLLYINDITTSIQSTIRLYADDVLIYRIIDSENDHLILQNDINRLEHWANLWSMNFNPNKCVHLRITNKKTFLNYSYTIYNQQLQQVSSAKYLGVTIDSHLNWKDHIDEISAKANSAKAFLRRNIYQCPKSIKSNCYKTFVRPILEYAAPVWSPFQHCQIYQIERIQRSMARFTLNDYSQCSSVTNMMNHLSWPTLESRRTFLKLLLFYKIEKKLVETSINLIPLTTITRGHPHRYSIPSANIDTYLNSFVPSTIKLWNNLPEPLVASNNFHEYKEHLSQFIFT